MIIISVNKYCAIIASLRSMAIIIRSNPWPLTPSCRYYYAVIIPNRNPNPRPRSLNQAEGAAPNDEHNVEDANKRHLFSGSLGRSRNQDGIEWLDGWLDGWPTRRPETEWSSSSSTRRIICIVPKRFLIVAMPSGLSHCLGTYAILTKDMIWYVHMCFIDIRVNTK